MFECKLRADEWRGKDAANTKLLKEENLSRSHKILTCETCSPQHCRMTTRSVARSLQSVSRVANPPIQHENRDPSRGLRVLFSQTWIIGLAAGLWDNRLRGIEAVAEKHIRRYCVTADDTRVKLCKRMGLLPTAILGMTEWVPKAVLRVLMSCSD